MQWQLTMPIVLPCRYTKSLAEIREAVSQLDLTSKIVKATGRHVILFLPTAIACAHRSFEKLDVNENVIGTCSVCGAMSSHVA